ncbi:MAG: two-component system cell cycle sensor histidine kinase/response regulator CckA [Candidatus Omnitrophota bacterium]|jgi:two-component system cell cycle sensor histidine kinase/response regulator CckA
MNTIESDSLFIHSPDAIFIEDYEGNILDVNPAACRLHGLTRDALIGTHVLDLVPPDVRAEVEATFRKWATGELSEYSGFSYAADGTVIPVDLRVNRITFKSSPALLIVARDVSIREVYRIALEESEKRFRDMVEHAPDSLLLLDVATGKVVEVNPNTERLFGMSRETLLTCGIAELSAEVQPNGRKSSEYAYELITAAKFDQPLCFEWDHLNASGKVLTCEIRLLKLTSNGRILVRGSLNNISMQKQAQKRVADLQVELGRARRIESAGLLAGGVAHDLNNILGPMVGYPDLLLDEIPGDSPLRPSLVEIKASAERAAAMIQDLLILSRRGHSSLHPMDLGLVIAEYLNSVEFQRLHARKPGIKIVVKADQALGLVNGSRAHLLRLVMNLVINAMQAMPDSGRITVSLRRRELKARYLGYEGIPIGSYLMLEVRDQGHGIPAEQLERIFEPFYSSKTEAGNNSGLGLAVVYGVIRDHDAYIDLESTVGEGTAFKIHFALLTNAVEEPEAPVDIQQAFGHVLVVDDVPEQRALATKLLERLGMSVTCVESGRLAVERVEQESFDVVLLDMTMGDDLDGLDTYRLIRQRQPDLPCMIASGYAETQRLKDVLALGAGPHLMKPYTLSRLSQSLQQLLRRIHA